jgi:hypothetical protein
MAINFNELQELLHAASVAGNNEKELRKSLVRVENLLASISTELASVYSLLDGVAPAKKPAKEYTGKKRGRPARDAASGTGELQLDLTPAPEARAGADVAPGEAGADEEAASSGVAPVAEEPVEAPKKPAGKSKAKK